MAFKELSQIEQNLLHEIAELDALPVGAYNIRMNGGSAGRNSTADIQIIPKEDVSGIDIRIADGTKKQSLHIPVIISQSGLKESVYNDFFVGDDCDVTIVAGCGIHCAGDADSEHDGIHAFHVGKRSRVRYVEKHYGEGEGKGKRLMNPTTVVELDEGAYMEMETTQISGINDTLRKTTAVLQAGATLICREKVMTTGEQSATSDFTCELNGDGASCDIVSRTVAKDRSIQRFISRIDGNCACKGHTACDSIIMDEAKVLATPQLGASHVDASLIHEAAIGKIAGEQLIKLMTLGLTEQEAEEQIVSGFLR